MTGRSLSRFALLVIALAACREPAAPAPSAQPAPPPPPSPGVEIDVVGVDGAPVARARVAAWARFDLETRDRDDEGVADERGHLSLALAPGRYGLTATAPLRAGGYAGGLEIAASGARPRLTLRLGGDGITLRGTVRDERGPLADVRVLAPALSENSGDVYVTRTDAGGRFTIQVPAGSDYFVVADAPPRRRVYARAKAEAANELVLGAEPAPRPSDEVLDAWLRASATPLPASGLDATAAAAFARLAGDAKIVALGEASHGAHEFPRDRMEVFEALVARGFTVYAVEVGWPDALALDDWIVTGRGDPRRAIAELVTWKDETEETLALVTWMRAYNADPKHVDKVHFVGFDILTIHAVPRLVDYVKKVDPRSATKVERELAPLAAVDADQTYPALPADVRSRTRTAIDALVARLDAERAALERRASGAAWIEARHLARIVQQADRSYGDYAARDAFLAENVAWLVEQNPRARIVLDAHNGHISAERHGLLEMGTLLRRRYRDDYRTLGFAFGEGSSRALDRRPGAKGEGLADFAIGRPPLDTFDAVLGRARLARFVIDLRAAPAPVRAWLRSPQRMHHLSGAFSGPDATLETYAPGDAFDAVIYEDRITPIHPLPRP